MEYPVVNQSCKTKRVCLALDLKDDPGLIKEYLDYHSPEKHWKEIADGIKQAGVLVMDIYKIDTRMIMICDIPEILDIDEVWAKMGTYPRQSEWGQLMSKYQEALPGHQLEWVKMERVFTLPES